MNNSQIKIKYVLNKLIDSFEEFDLSANEIYFLLRIIRSNDSSFFNMVETTSVFLDEVFAGMSDRTIRRRLKSLKEKGVITDYSISFISTGNIVSDRQISLNLFPLERMIKDKIIEEGSKSNG